VALSWEDFCKGALPFFKCSGVAVQVLAWAQCSSRSYTEFHDNFANLWPAALGCHAATC
jgi:hypothetical protein